GEKILIYGDYDVDGTTAVAVMFRFISSIHSNCDFYIPHRYREGYGISQQGIDFALENGFNLIISLDCGIKSVELIRYAQTNGIDFIVCDHHLPDEELPPAVAILNPKQSDCHYPFKELCGCGVGFKLIQALCIRLGKPDDTWQNFLDLVAIAIAADIVPIIGENRILTYYGLKKVNDSPSTGVKALIKLSNMEGLIHVNNLVFVIAPRVNAAGRMDDARKAVELFISENDEKAFQFAEELHSDNDERREVDLSITEQAIAMIDNNEDLRIRKSTVLHDATWHKGVVGIVASRLIEKYYRPTVVLTDSGEKVAGSARSVLGFNIYEAIHQCRELLENYGGHFYAAGLTLKKENVGPFSEKFEEVVASSITPEMLVPEITIDCKIEFKDITQKFYDILCQMEPFGPENMRPVFIAEQVYETGKSRIVKDAHIKFELVQNGITIDGIGFGLSPKFGILTPNQPLDIVFTLDENEWNNIKRIQLRVIDIRKSFEYSNN
ncbi:MAG: single-stranded-DNA-specific exonuclease RecJ, partial [Chitinophagaceae bacterium]|nr:single-stranded-DNA-specific exonuclease RecJ [Chitinophagaceae bacterium]